MPIYFKHELTEPQSFKTNKQRRTEKCKIKRCNKDEKYIKSLKFSKYKLESKVDDLESRSMRENLMFYGIYGGGDNENFEDLVKNVCSKTLKITTSHQLLFDREVIRG